MKDFINSVDNVITLATAKDAEGKPLNRGELAAAYGIWTSEKRDELTPEALKGWARKRIALYRYWIANLEELMKDCDKLSFSRLSTAEIEALLAERKKAEDSVA